MQKLLLALSGLGLALALLSFQNTPSQNNPETPAEAAARHKAMAALLKTQGPSYPLDTCIISGKQLGSNGEPIDLNQDGRLVRLCCKACVKTVQKDPASVLKKLDDAVILAQRGLYPLDTCVISGEKLGEMGPPVEHVDGTRLVRFCCESCVSEYKKDPAASMAKVNAALIEKLKQDYPLDTCPIDGKKLGENGAPSDVLYGVQLVRTCSQGCAAAFDKDPAAALAKVAEAKKAAGKG